MIIVKDKFLIIANIKQNPLPAYDFVIPDSLEVVVAPRLPDISKVSAGFTRAAQNVDGNARQLKDLGVKYCLVGHSYYRNNFGETNEIVQKKVEELKAVGIIPIVCARSLEEVVPAEIIMFEPEGAISTNGQYHPESPEKIQEVLSTFPQDAKLLYGGSVNPEDCSLIIAHCPLVSGFVIGHACLNPAEFLNIIKQCP